MQPSQEPAPGSIAALSLAVFSDLVANLTHDVVLQAHRQEKILRTQQQQHHARIAAAAAVHNGASPQEDTSVPRMPSGNPLATVPAEYLCNRCYLPKHTNETLNGPPVILPTGERKKYCSSLPLQSQRGRDIYGNLFPNPAGTNGKKAGAKKDTPTDGNSPSSVNTPGGDEAATLPVATTNSKKNSGITYIKCNNCENEKVASSRFAAHLEKCLGFAGRKSSRAAMQKMNNSTNSAAASPMLPPADDKAAPKPSPAPQLSESASSSAPAPAHPSTSASAPSLPPPPTPKKKKDSAGLSASGASGQIAAPKKRKRKVDDDSTAPKKQKTSVANLASTTAPSPSIASGGTPTPTPETPKKLAPSGGGTMKPPSTGDEPKKKKASKPKQPKVVGEAVQQTPKKKVKAKSQQQQQVLVTASTGGNVQGPSPQKAGAKTVPGQGSAQGQAGGQQVPVARKALPGGGSGGGAQGGEG